MIEYVLIPLFSMLALFACIALIVVSYFFTRIVITSFVAALRWAWWTALLGVRTSLRRIRGWF